MVSIIFSRHRQKNKIQTNVSNGVKKKKTFTGNTGYNLYRRVRWELLKCILALWYQIKGLMTSKGPGHFLAAAQTCVCVLDLDSLLGLNWTVPWGRGLNIVQVVKAQDLEL